MEPITDLDGLRRAMAENSAEPEGPGRNARAERLLAEAERLDVPLAVIEALGHQLKVYNYSSEKAKMFVPFARLLRMWDEHPEDFDEYEAHSLHWVFKWVSAGMLDQPHVPLAAVEKWLGEMEHRYRVAGYSERAVRAAEFGVASHVGDVTRAERAYTAWLAADRDAMADCHACELHAQGCWQAERGRDEEALGLWRPVLDGEFTCAHQPHAALASSLAPLLRLGRADEARAHHLRGIRLVRPMESMRSAYADHVEFCALSGNEARGLELLAERPAYFTDDGHPRSGMDFLCAVALLMDRLTALGLGDRPVPGPPGRSWTAGELGPHARVEALALAARFDERNGTAYVGDRARAQMAQRPLMDRLPLGIRTARPARPAATPGAGTAAPGPGASPSGSGTTPSGPGAVTPDPGATPPGPGTAAPGAGTAAPGAGTTPPGSGVTTPAPAAGADPAVPGTDPAAPGTPASESAPAAPGLSALIAEARRASDTLQPHAGEAWAAVDRAAGDAGLDPRDRAEIAEHRAMELGPDGVGLFARAAELYAEAGDPGESLAAHARAAYVRALAGDLEGALAAVAAPCEAVRALYAEGGTGARQTAAVLMSRARVLMRRVHETEAADAEAAEAAAREVLALVAGRTGEDVRLAARQAEAEGMLAELAGRAGDLTGAVELFGRAARGFTGAGLPWFAVEYEARLAQLAHHLGDVEETERALRAALEHGGPYLEPTGRARLCLQLAEVTGGRGAVEEAAGHALEAAHWADEAGEGPTVGAWARQQLGGFLLAQGRWAEAAEVLESALPDMTAETHGDGAVVQTLWWLGDCLTELGEHRAAAERRLAAADLARHWPEQHDHATLAHLAATSLDQAGLAQEAERAFVRAGDLWRSLGDVHGLVRAVRSRAWLALRSGAGPERARELMAAAVEECEAALGTASDPASRARISAELGHSHQQFAELLAGSPEGDASAEEALSRAERASAAFAAAGPDAVPFRAGAELLAGRLAAALGRPDRAAAHARAVLALHADTDAEDHADGTAARHREEAAHLLRSAEEGTPEPSET
ncbi:tetratricopeptide repeat protein [Streptomyces sp. NPDC000134]|uniref:tetratricopeptide repeat protein n=1 Tax=Streptomyces sp. NPDC000134 TaxID=3364536 RepID=UPI0036CBF547